MAAGSRTSRETMGKLSFMIVVAAVLLVTLQPAWAATFTWDGSDSTDWATDGNWVNGTAPGSSDDVVIDGNYSGVGYTNPPTLDVSGGSVTIKSLSLGANNTSVLTIAFGSPTEKFIITNNCTIGTNGTLTHTTNYNAETHRIFMDVSNNFTIAQGGEINVKAKGYVTSGPGYDAKAAGYGGEGGQAVGTTYGSTYGSITAPTNLGSGCAYAGYAAGGAVILTIGGIGTIDGTICADGSAGLNYAPSGGSVYITAGAIAGSGTITADGGDGGGSNDGGGGRIAIVLTSGTDFGNITIHAYGGEAGVYHDAAAGTIYLEKSTDPAGQGELIVDNDDGLVDDYGRMPKALLSKTVQKGDGPSSYVFSRITLTNAGVYALDSDDTLVITGTTINGDSGDRYAGFYVEGGTLTIPSGAFTWTNYFIAMGTTGDKGGGIRQITVHRERDVISEVEFGSIPEYDSTHSSAGNIRMNQRSGCGRDSITIVDY
ncbi:hypothetical protein ACFLQR_03600 [Verrucomicrobiota bacterium]